MDPIREEVLEKARLLEKIDYTLRIVGVRNWIILSFFVATLVLALIWSFTGTIPVVLPGKCIVFTPESSIRVRSAVKGIVTDLKVKEGDLVNQGDILVVLDEDHPVTAPVTGTVYWVDVVWGSTVDPEQVLLWVQKPSSPENLTVLGFFSLYAGQQIKPGMEVQIALNQQTTEIYGMVEGVVKEVLRYPLSSTDSYMQKIPSEPLREFLIQGPLPMIAVVVQPTLDPHNPSGWKWTSEKGPAHPIQLGSLGEMQVLLAKWKPIAFLFPFLKREEK